MTSEKPYLLDGEPVTFSVLIQAAKKEGYGGPDGIYLVSEAAAVLREHGHIVADNPN